MAKINVLDCTLRDGGYCNQWRFGYENIKKITSGLVEASVDIIECGFLTEQIQEDADVSKYATMEAMDKIVPDNKKNKLFVCMLNYGEYDLAKLPECSRTKIDGIRVAFHKSNLEEALEVCKIIAQKGYKVFVQAMVSLNYSDDEFLALIRKCNEFLPYAFYIVDSFGVMKRKDLIRLFYLVEHNLSTNIAVGYHSHNNLQLAYSNAQALADIRTNRDMIFDSSIFGMGRGAGNLNTELFVEYLNDSFGSNYALKPLLTIIDEVLTPFYKQNYWGYSLPNYLSAKHNAHPNYAGYLDGKNTLTAESMDEIFTMMDDTKKANYDKGYIEDVYVKYMASGKVIETHLDEFKQRILNRNVLLIAPGKSSEDEKDKIIKFINKNDVITISVNFDYTEYETEFIFVSNLRRFRNLDTSKYEKCIITSNIPSVDAYLQTKYSDLLNGVEAVNDNAGLMLIRFLANIGVEKIYLAGLDGYSLDLEENFVDKKMAFYAKKAEFDAMNEGLSNVLNSLKDEIAIEFITAPKFVKI